MSFFKESTDIPIAFLILYLTRKVWYWFLITLYLSVWVSLIEFYLQCLTNYTNTQCEVVATAAIDQNHSISDLKYLICCNFMPKYNYCCYLWVFKCTVANFFGGNGSVETQATRNRHDTGFSGYTRGWGSSAETPADGEAWGSSAEHPTSFTRQRHQLLHLRINQKPELTGPKFTGDCSWGTVSAV